MLTTSEYRRGLIGITLVATPTGAGPGGQGLRGRRGHLRGGLAATAVTAALAGAMLGDRILPVGTATEARVVAGTAALMAVAAVLAVAVGTILRRSAGAVTAVVVLIVLPYLLAVASVLPADAADWLLRLTPAAGFAVQQSIPAYPQVDAVYVPATGYYPLDPWAGLAVLCAWAAVGLGLAAIAIRRRDA